PPDRVSLRVTERFTSIKTITQSLKIVWKSYETAVSSTKKWLVLAALCSGLAGAAVGQEVLAPPQWQPKLTPREPDQNRNSIEDEIEAIPNTERVGVVLALNDCPKPGDFGRFEQHAPGSTVAYVGQYITVVCLDNVLVSDIPKLAADERVAMVQLAR